MRILMILCALSAVQEGTLELSAKTELTLPPASLMTLVW